MTRRRVRATPPVERLELFAPYLDLTPREYDIVRMLAGWGHPLDGAPEALPEHAVQDLLSSILHKARAVDRATLAALRAVRWHRRDRSSRFPRPPERRKPRR